MPVLVQDFYIITQFNCHKFRSYLSISSISSVNRPPWYVITCSYLSVWVRWKPECGDEDICYLPTWPALINRIGPLFLDLMLTRDATGRRG